MDTGLTADGYKCLRAAVYCFTLKFNLIEKVGVLFGLLHYQGRI